MLRRIPPDAMEVILVDGGSVDRTVAVARETLPLIRVIQQTRTGKGNALACGFAASRGDIIAMIDADGSTDPGEIPAFVAALLDGADYAKGSRFRAGGGSEDITRTRRIGNLALNTTVNVLFRTRFSDLCYGYNAFWRRVLPSLDLPDIAEPAGPNGAKVWGDGFEIETMMNVRAAANGLRVCEVASREASRLYGSSNLRTVRDGARVLRTILREFRRHRLRKRRNRPGVGRPQLRPAIETAAQGLTFPQVAAHAGEPAPPTQRTAAATPAWHTITSGHTPVVPGRPATVRGPAAPPRCASTD